MKLLAAVLFAVTALGQNPGPSRGGGLATPYTPISYAGAECDNFSSSATSLACTLTVSSSGTQTLLIFVSVDATKFISTTSTCGTVSAIRNVNWNNVDASTAYAMAVYNATPGSCTVTATMTTSNFPTLMVADFANANASAPIDDASCGSTPFCSGAGVSGTAITNGTITTANSNEMVVGWAENYSVGNLPITVAGFTGIPGTTASAFYAMNYSIEGSPGAYTPSFTGTFPWVAMAVALTK